MNRQQTSGSGKLSWRDGLWLILYLSQIALGASLLDLSSRIPLPAVRLYSSTLPVLGAVAVVLALDLRAFRVSQERWAAAGQTLLTIGALTSFSLLGGNVAVARWLSWALIEVGIAASLGLLATRLLGRKP